MDLKKTPVVMLPVLTAGLLGLLIWSAWLVEDAFITLRTVDNFINGYGLRWNISERVQTYTHPLWMFLLTAGALLSGEAYYSTIFVSIATSMAGAILLAYWISASPRIGLVALLVLGTSQAYIDYATSGLENPLTHLLLALFFLRHIRQAPHAPFALALIAGLATLNRMDTILLYIPSLYVLVRRGHIRPLLAGFIPFALWEAFSLLYYGFLFPNTAYAKLLTDRPATELVLRGLEYLADSLTTDPITMPIIVAGVLTPYLTRRTELANFSLGILLYTAYVVVIGGGYMSGRFLTAPFFAALCVLAATIPLRSNRTLLLLIAAILVCDLSASKSVLRGKTIEHRADFHHTTSLIRALSIAADTPFPDHIWANRARFVRDPDNDLDEYREGYLATRTQRGLTITTWRTVGFSGFYAGPQVHIIDAYAITDPLLARIPPYRNPDWVSGHMQRIIPKGYIETHISGVNSLDGKNLKEYYDHLSSIIGGDIFDPQRIETVIRMNLGEYDHLIDNAAYANPSKLDLLHNEVQIRPLPPNRYELAKELIATGDSIAAIRELELASRARPNNYDNHLLMGNLAFAADRIETARDMFARAVAIDSSKVEAHINLAGTLIKAGDIAGAVPIYRRTLQLDPHNAIATHMLAKLGKL